MPNMAKEMGNSSPSGISPVLMLMPISTTTNKDTYRMEVTISPFLTPHAAWSRVCMKPLKMIYVPNNTHEPRSINNPDMPDITKP